MSLSEKTFKEMWNKASPIIKDNYAENLKSARWGYAQAEKDIMNKPSWEFYAGKQTAKEEFRARDAKLRKMINEAINFSDETSTKQMLREALLLVEEAKT